MQSHCYTDWVPAFAGTTDGRNDSGILGMTIVFDGLAAGMLLFLISVGLSVTLGLMNFVNLAHGAFAMLGGYVCARLLAGAGVPFLLAVPAAAIAAAAAGVVLERTLYRRLYGASHLDQVLFSIGLVFMSISTAHYFFGAQQQPFVLPDFLKGQINLPGLDVGVYRLFLIGVGAVLALALQWLVSRTRFGARLRAAVDNPRAARGLGIDIDRVFTLTFALGSALAGLGGALGIEMLGLDPGFPLRYIVYFLIVVAVGGSGNIKGSLYASLLLGICDVAGKYYLPQAGAFVIYGVMVVMLIVRPQGLFGRSAAR
jgi:branched-chain amino acid transport system permease protein